MNAPNAWRMEQVMSICMSLRARLVDEDPELADDTAALIEAMGQDGEEAETLIRRIIRAHLEADAYADAAKARIAAISERAKRYAKRAEVLRGAAFSAMDALGLPKIEDAEFTASIRRGSSRPIVTDEAMLPDEFWRVKRDVALSDIGVAIKAGREIPGVEMSNTMPSLTIKVR